MEKIRITVLPNVRRSECAAVRINPDTNERLIELADSIGFSVARVADYLLNVAMDRIVITAIDGAEGGNGE